MSIYSGYHSVNQFQPITTCLHRGMIADVDSFNLIHIAPFLKILQYNALGRNSKKNV